MIKKNKTKKISLHIGCGINYRPDCVNIDLYNDSIADIIAHASFLPFKSETIRSIETYHLIEHFDWVEVKYLLNEWYRVLEDDSDLIIETPNLNITIGKLNDLSDINAQIKTLQWIYGVEWSGMRHKTGFTMKILENFLRKVGFNKIKNEIPHSHKYESGLRIKCKKHSRHANLSNIILHEFRTKLSAYIFFNKIDCINLLERNHLEPIESYLLSKSKMNQITVYFRLLSKLIICNPLLAFEFCKVLKNHSIFENEVDYDRIIIRIKYFNEIKFHQRVFTLWTLRKRNSGKFAENFKSFINELELKILKILTNNSDYKRIFNYIASMKTEKIPFFDLFFILEAGNIFLNQGIKAFNFKNIRKAKYLLFRSIKLNPDNFIAYWNLARLGVITNDSELRDLYTLALDLVDDNKLKKIIREEITQVKKKLILNDITKPIIIP